VWLKVLQLLGFRRTGGVLLLGYCAWALVLHMLGKDMLDIVLLSFAPFVVFDVTGCIAQCVGRGLIP
jgi:hypothetical protein